MNYVALTGGLGNQMFIYAFKVSLSQNNTVALFRPYRKHSPQYGNAGYQIEQIFNIVKERDKARLLLFSIYYHIIRLAPRRVRPRLLQLAGYKELRVQDNFVYYDGIINNHFDKTLFRGTWQSEKYFINVSDTIRRTFTFNQRLINEKTRALWEKIQQMPNPVSIHVRRNDYLSSQYIAGFGGICTTDYYQNAVEYIESQLDDPSFIVFSDDIEWCRNNMDLFNAIYVDWNAQNESWQDMFLMSKCKHNIIANSSFSWWGAYLNPFDGKIVIAPKVWWNGIEDDVVPNNWIRL